jgi:DNA replication licensing factor MCM7
MALRYAKLREDALSDPTEGHITARMLLAMLRLSTALARLRFSDEVVMDDFEEALRLMESCKVGLVWTDYLTFGVNRKFSPLGLGAGCS